MYTLGNNRVSFTIVEVSYYTYVDYYSVEVRVSALFMLLDPATVCLDKMRFSLEHICAHYHT
jgi:hypothetical protein